MDFRPEPPPGSLATPRAHSQVTGSFLILSASRHDAVTCSEWSFSGDADLELRRCLDLLDEFVAPDLQNWSSAAVVFGAAESNHGRPTRGCVVKKPERAWTIEGAVRLAELLPDSLAGLRQDLLRRFSDRDAEPLAA